VSALYRDENAGMKKNVEAVNLVFDVKFNKT